MRGYVVLGLVFPYQAKRLPILRRVGRKTSTQSINQSGNEGLSLLVVVGTLQLRAVHTELGGSRVCDVGTSTPRFIGH